MELFILGVICGVLMAGVIGSFAKTATESLIKAATRAPKSEQAK